ncbi:MAG TPA: alpha/beta hydrolase-fold protein, partial [Aggregatilineales bacterium]|nr:alpha/beta hydrolase-fold protein [Aggregatilineales bacterium]
MTMSAKVRVLSLIVAVLYAAACEPLAPDATRVVIVLTSAPTATKLPTAIPQPTDTPTIVPTDTPTVIPTATQWVCGESKGQMVDLTFYSSIEKAQVAYRVYLPPCYAEMQRRFPYVILMHGSDGDQTYWTDQLGVQTALDTGITVQALPPMILVMPDGGQLMNTNIFRDGASWESVVLDELMPEIAKTLCVWNAREGRAIGGISRGGFWAFEIAFRHPELFSAVGGHSAFFDTQSSVGPAYNPLLLAKSVQFPDNLTPRFWLDAGQDD